MRLQGPQNAFSGVDRVGGWANINGSYVEARPQLMARCSRSSWLGYSPPIYFLSLMQHSMFWSLFMSIFVKDHPCCSYFKFIQHTTEVLNGSYTPAVTNTGALLLNSGRNPNLSTPPLWRDGRGPVLRSGLPPPTLPAPHVPASDWTSRGTWWTFRSLSVGRRLNCILRASTPQALRLYTLRFRCLQATVGGPARSPQVPAPVHPASPRQPPQPRCWSRCCRALPHPQAATNWAPHVHHSARSPRILADISRY